MQGRRMSTVIEILEVEDIIAHGRGDIARHGRHEPKCTGAVNIAGAHFQCDLYPNHNGWAHSSSEGHAIWQ